MPNVASSRFLHGVSQWRILLWLSGVATIFLLDLVTPLGISVWILYLLPIWFVARLPSGTHASRAITAEAATGTGLCTGLLVLGFFLSPAGSKPWIDVILRLIGIALLWVTALVLVRSTRQKEALRQGDERLRSALDAARMGTFDWNLLTDSVVCSPGHSPLVGYSTETVTMTGKEFLRHVHPGDCRRVEATVAETVTTGTHYHCEYRVVWPDGRVYWVQGKGRGLLR